MLLKTVQIVIPNDKTINEILTFSPEENYLMLKIGSECLIEGKKQIIGLTQKEIYEKIKNESKEDIQKIELEIMVQKEMSKKMEDKISQIYEGQLEQLKKQLLMTSDQLKNYEKENKDIIQKEVDKVREKYDLLVDQKDKQVNRLTENYEKILVQQNKSTSLKGSEGEKQFSDYAETFKDFKGFEIIDKHTQGGQGDFHLHFEEFDILVDAKNYKKKVPIDQREKIKKDLIKNDHINFAWLVSLNTSIDKWDKSTIMYEWINTNQCIVYINNLLSFEDPQKILRIVWFTCKELYKLIEDITTTNITELTELKEKNYKMMDKIKNIRKGIREINTTFNTTRNMIQLMDDELREILETETNKIVTSNFSLFDDWWNKNIETTTDEIIIISTDLWIKFKQDNKINLKEFEITTEKFKKYIKSKVPISNLLIKSKNINSAFDIKGIKMKNIEENKIHEKIDVELVEDLIKKKT